MPQPRKPIWKAASQEDESLPTLVGDLRDLVLAYAKQQTIDPLKQLGRYVGYGLAGGILLAFGIVVLSIGLLRALQAEAGEHLEGSLSWVPYLVVVAFLVAVAALTARRISMAPSKEQR